MGTTLAGGQSAQSLSSLRALRTLRALRPLRVASRLAGMKVVVNSLFARWVGKSMLDVTGDY